MHCFLSEVNKQEGKPQKEDMLKVKRQINIIIIIKKPTFTIQSHCSLFFSTHGTFLASQQTLLTVPRCICE